MDKKTGAVLLIAAATAATAGVVLLTRKTQAQTQAAFTLTASATSADVGELVTFSGVDNADPAGTTVYLSWLNTTTGTAEGDVASAVTGSDGSYSMQYAFPDAGTYVVQASTVLNYTPTSTSTSTSTSTPSAA